MKFLLIFLMVYYNKCVKGFYTLNSQDGIDQLHSDNIGNAAMVLKLLKMERDLKDRNIVIVKTNIDKTKPILRLNYDVETKNKKSKERIIMQQHKARMKEVNEFMKDHMITTKYLYDEVKRIQRDRTVKDELREMVEHLEKPENKDEKEMILKFFKRNKRIYGKKKINVWDQKSNDLVINIVKDPFNDGTIN